MFPELKTEFTYLPFPPADRRFSGSRIINVVPLSRSDSKSISPPCSLMIFLVSIKPKPVPLEPLVVKNCWNIFAPIAVFMPQPLSMTRYSTAQPSAFSDCKDVQFFSGICIDDVRHLVVQDRTEEDRLQTHEAAVKTGKPNVVLAIPDHLSAPVLRL